MTIAMEITLDDSVIFDVQRDKPTWDFTSQNRNHYFEFLVFRTTQKQNECKTQETKHDGLH